MTKRPVNQNNAVVRNTMRFLGAEAEDALEIAEKIDVDEPGRSCRAAPRAKACQNRTWFAHVLASALF
jgi:hypothetical protein